MSQLTPNHEQTLADVFQAVDASHCGPEVAVYRSTNAMRSSAGSSHWSWAT